ncbi:MAG: purine-nucleoside phosphorylase [Bacteroidetes bacterium]|nr:purine-nucleoside phosphorylase [Bacteroidota bacterium]MDA0874161.1 purine-nucleoside phosphorylase [Bacteroidota bacterium]
MITDGPSHPEPALDRAVAHVRARVSNRPRLGLILGSGLSDLADVVEHPVVLETADIPGYQGSTVQGHKGRLVFGRLEGVDVVFVQGRLHVYEGHSVADATFPVRLLAALGVEGLIITNAAGGIRTDFVPGTLMWITDHIPFAFRDIPAPTSVSSRPGREAPTPWDLEWTSRAADIADRLGIPTRSGTYLWTLGPSYETKAEIRMFAGFGADAVGMSTVPEAIVARDLSVEVLGISTITNHAAGLGHETLDHSEVLEVGRQVRADLQRLITALVGEFGTRSR